MKQMCRDNIFFSISSKKKEEKKAGETAKKSFAIIRVRNHQK